MHPFYQLFRINNINKTQNYIKIAFFFNFFLFLFFIFTCSQTVPYRYLVVILVKVASCSCVHSFVASGPARKSSRLLGNAQDWHKACRDGTKRTETRGDVAVK